MKNKNLLIIAGLITFIVATAGTLSETGKSGKAGSPGESTCVQCHQDNPVNSGSGSVIFSSTMSGWTYQANQTYTMTVTINETGMAVFGLGVEALKNSDNTNAGTFTITNSTQTQTMTASNGRISVTHKMDGGFTPNSKAFTFNWTAPATGVGAVTFYVATIAGDHDGSDAGDNVYTTTQVVNPSTVDIDELVSNIRFTVSPNPVKDDLNIYVDNVNGRYISAELFSITGSKVADLFSEIAPGGVLNKHISVSSFAKGIYMVKVKASGKSITKRIIIE